MRLRLSRVLFGLLCLMTLLLIKNRSTGLHHKQVVHEAGEKHEDAKQKRQRLNVANADDAQFVDPVILEEFEAGVRDKRPKKEEAIKVVSARGNKNKAGVVANEKHVSKVNQLKTTAATRKKKASNSRLEAKKTFFAAKQLESKAIAEREGEVFKNESSKSVRKADPVENNLKDREGHGDQAKVKDVRKIKVAVEEKVKEDEEEEVGEEPFKHYGDMERAEGEEEEEKDEEDEEEPSDGSPKVSRVILLAYPR